MAKQRGILLCCLHEYVVYLFELELALEKNANVQFVEDLNTSIVG